MAQASKPARRRGDLVRGVARLASGALALLGALPLLLVLLTRTSWVRRELADLTRRALFDVLELRVDFDAEIELLPPSLVLKHLVLPSTDGGSPAAEIDRVAIRPSFFSLLAGKLDVGDVEVEHPRVRLVIGDDGPRNVHIKLPKSDKSKPDTPLEEIPLRALSISAADVDVSLVDLKTRLELFDLDVDVQAGKGIKLDYTLRAQAAHVTRERPASLGRRAVDDDVVCELSSRGRFEGRELLVRSLKLAARLDDDGRPGTRRRCDGQVAREDDLRLAARRLSVTFGDTPIPLIHGHLFVQAPARIVDRITPDGPAITGDATLDVDIDHQGRLELPVVRGDIKVHELMLFGERQILKSLDGKVETSADEARLVSALARYADGEVTIPRASIKPFEPGLPVAGTDIELRGVRFPALMRDIGVTRHTIVDWTFDHGTIKNFHGNVIDPETKGPNLISDIVVQTSGFEVTSGAWDDPRRGHILQIRRAVVRGKWGFQHNGVFFKNCAIDFGQSHVEVASVLIGFDTELEISVPKGSLDLADISPIAVMPLAGRAELSMKLSGGQKSPRIDGDLRATGFKLGDLPVADSIAMTPEFTLFTLDLKGIKAQKGSSRFESPLVRLDLNHMPHLVVAGNISSEAMSVRDLLAIFRMEDDPRYAEMHGVGRVKASMRFDANGPEDVCKTGAIFVRAQADLGVLDLFGERYDSGRVDMDMRWLDREADVNGADIDIHSALLRKGRGTVFGAGTVRGGKLAGHVMAHEVPLSRLDALGDLGRAVDGTASFVGRVGGSIAAIEVRGQAGVSAVRVGQKTLPPSSFSLELEPEKAPPPLRKSRACRNDVPSPFVLREYERDLPQGVFKVNGSLFGKQITMSNVTMTQQRKKRVAGVIELRELDLGALMQLSPGFVLSEAPPTGSLSGRIDVTRLEVDRPERAQVALSIEAMRLSQGQITAEVKPRGEGQRVALRLDNDELSLDETRVSISAGKEVRGEREVSADVLLGGRVRAVSTRREADVKARLLPFDVARVAQLSPQIESASGKIEGQIALKGPLAMPQVRGDLSVKGGSLAIAGLPLGLDGVEVLAEIDERELRLVRGQARTGGGEVSVTARMPLRGLDPGDVSARVEARGVRLPLAPGVDMTASAALSATWSPRRDDAGKRRKVLLTGDVDVESFLYTKPITISADFDTLARGRQRTEVTVYDPESDMVELGINIRPRAPLVFRNNLIEAEVVLDSDALVLTGTTQRRGLRGQLRVSKGGQLKLRGNDFDITQGTIRFDDPTRIAPRVDLAAVTEYRRYTTSTQGSAASTTASAGRAGGSWRIRLHAHGDADDLKLALTSEPGLPQEDIVLLLTAGMTRAELDQLQASNLGGAAALEALSALSGADTAVKTVIPIIDDFRFGSAYSNRTGRTEPTVAVGKKLSDRLRANVVTGLTENRDVRSNVEWRISPSTSVLGNYDNLNDVTSRGLGNVGADFRIRLEF